MLYRVWVVLATLFALSASGRVAADLVNGSFEQADKTGAPAGWTVHTRLDPNSYGPEPDGNFDNLAPVRCSNGRAGTPHCAGFPADGTWTASVCDHSTSNGSAVGKAALSQAVTLDPGTYVFGAYLRTAGGAAYTAAFSLGYASGYVDYSHDDSTGIRWTSADLGLNTSFDGTGDLRKRGEWLRHETKPFTLKTRGPVTVWIRFNYVNNNSLPARWQVDDAYIRACTGTPPLEAAQVRAKPSMGEPVRRQLPGQMLADCGDLERGYLSSDDGSTIRGSIPRRMFQHARCASSTASFAYAFPVDPRAESVYVAFEHMGPVRVTFSGVVDRADTGASDDALHPKQYLLTDRSLWRTGKLEVRFTSPVEGKDVAVAWVEAGTTTRFRERLKNVVWDTSGVAWSIGLWDSSSREFTGTQRDARIGSDDASRLNGRDLRIEWTQQMRPECRYYLVLGHIRQSGDESTMAKVNIGDDELAEHVSSTRGEEILEVDITDHLVAGRNVVSVSADAIDFVSLVVQTPGIIDNRRLGLYFGGNDDAENATRVCHNTLFWLLSLHYDDSGFIDASVPHGKWWQQYWPVDISFALRALLAYGYVEESERIATLVAREAWSGHQSNRSGGSDNNGGNIIALEMCELLRRRNFDPALTSQLWTAVAGYCDTLCEQAGNSPFGLIKGTNWENAGNREQGPCYALTTNLSAAAVLRKATDTAAEGGLRSSPDKWYKTADSIRAAVLDRLVFEEDAESPTGWVYPKNTWAYGILDDGGWMLQPLAGYLWAGMHCTTAYGFIDRDKAVRDLYDRTVDIAVEVFDGPRANLISGYAESYDSAGMVLGCGALSDRLDILEKMIPKLLTETDYEHDIGEPTAELSRWAYGPGGWEEDTNLVGAAAFLDTLRFIPGIDDILSGGAQLRILPRLPASWNEVGVNDWTVQHRTATGLAMTRLSFNYRCTAQGAEMTLRSDDTIRGLEVRLGPLAEREKPWSVRIDGRPAASRAETGGGYDWLWVTLDCGPRMRVIRTQ